MRHLTTVTPQAFKKSEVQHDAIWFCLDYGGKELCLGA